MRIPVCVLILMMATAPIVAADPEDPGEGRDCMAEHGVITDASYPGVPAGRYTNQDGSGAFEWIPDPENLREGVMFWQIICSGPQAAMDDICNWFYLTTGVDVCQYLPDT